MSGKTKEEKVRVCQRTSERIRDAHRRPESVKEAQTRSKKIATYSLINRAGESQ